MGEVGEGEGEKHDIDRRWMHEWRCPKKQYSIGIET
jgi:hypothetical protein